MSPSQRADESRIEELETKAAFQEDLIDSLNAVVARQDRELAALSRRIEALESKVDDLADAASLPGDAPGHEVPPHY